MPVLPFRSPDEVTDTRSAKAGKPDHNGPPPRPEHILEERAFRKRLILLAEEQNISSDQALQTAERYLKEIAARPSKPLVAIAAWMGRFLYRRAYGSVHYNRDELVSLHRLSSRHPIAVLPAHRSNLDRPVMHDLLWRNGLGPNHTAGGINMNFFPIGPIARRAGVFFIRRTFANKPIYKLVLRTYIGYLVEQRLPLEWYIEGGRSRTGKLRSPRYGLLSYAADAVTAGKSADLYLIPTSISYDHVLEVGAYATEESGATKETESFRWLVRSVRSLRRRYGNIHIRFGEPISLRRALGPESVEVCRRRNLRLLAAEVCERINEITPVTLSSLVVVALLAGPEQGPGLPRSRIEATVSELVDAGASRRIPSLDPSIRLRTGPWLEAELSALTDLGIVTVEPLIEEGSHTTTVYRIPKNQRLAASYYRNTIAHFFLARAIAELALVAASHAAPGHSPYNIFREYVDKVADLLAFEFFLGDPDRLSGEIESELHLSEPRWRERVTEGHASELLALLRPHRAPWVLGSFIESYRLVAQRLVDLPAAHPWDEKPFLRLCLDHGTHSAASRKVAGDALSLSLFSNAIRIAKRRDLVGDVDRDTLERRTAFASELSNMLEYLDRLDTSIPTEPHRRSTP